MKTKTLAKSLMRENTQNYDYNRNFFKQSMIKQKFANDLNDKNKGKSKKNIIKGYKNQKKMT